MLSTMSTYKDLDAFKACHELTMAVCRLTSKFEEQDGELAARMRSAAVVASSRIARGSGFRDRRRFLPCVDRSAAALAELEAYLVLGRELELISSDDHRELDSLGGRALFYVMKLAMSLERPKAAEEEAT